MKLIFALFGLPALFAWTPLDNEFIFTDQLPVNEIFESVPQDLDQSVLLIPRYDFVGIEDLPEGAPFSVAKQINSAAKKGNTTINEMAIKGYKFDYKLVSMSDIDSLKAQGYTYYLDMVLMPKQMKYPEAKAMVPTWEKYGTTNRMFRNRYTQFQFYFYIRDLRSNDAYITTRFRGTSEVYVGMKKFFQQASKDAALTDEGQH